MLSREQAQALTRLTHLLRPAWSEEGIYAALAKCRDLEAFEVALVRAATVPRRATRPDLCNLWRARRMPWTAPRRIPGAVIFDGLGVSVAWRGDW